MPEYSGYISVNPVDWGKVAKDAGQEVIDVLKNRRDERIRLDDLNNNLQAEIANYEATKSPEANEFIMAGSQTARSYIQTQNDLLKAGQITPEQYKRNIQNTQVGFKGFKVVMDTFASNIEEARRLMESGVTGKQAEWVNDVNGKMLTLKNKLMTVGSNGGLYIKDVDSGELYDVQSLTNQQNRVVKKVQLIPEVEKSIKGLGVGAKYDAASNKYIISSRILGDWEKTKEDVANAILSSDSRIASVLADNLEGYSFTDKKERGENEILMERDANRVWSPKLTDAQKERARQIVMDQIEERVDYKESEPRSATSKKTIKRGGDQGVPKRSVTNFWENKGETGEFGVAVDKYGYGSLEREDFLEDFDLIKKELDIDDFDFDKVTIARVVGPQQGTGKLSDNVTVYLKTKKGGIIKKKGGKGYMPFTIKGDRKMIIAEAMWRKSGMGKKTNPVFISEEMQTNEPILDVLQRTTATPTAP